MPIAGKARILTPDAIMDGFAVPSGKRIVVWDDDNFYMGGVIAELLADQGCNTLYLTCAAEASTWTRNTMEQGFIQKRLLEKGVAIRAFTSLEAVSMGTITVSCVFTGRTEEIEADAVVLVTSRLSEDRLAQELSARSEDWSDAGVELVTTIGDALAPATIAHAVYAGRRYAEELDGAANFGNGVPFRREITELAPLDE